MSPPACHLVNHSGLFHRLSNSPARGGSAEPVLVLLDRELVSDADRPRFDDDFSSAVRRNLDLRTQLETCQCEAPIFQEKILKLAKLPKMRIHDLRHSAAAILIAQGVDARSISESLGAQLSSIALQVYGHLLESTKRETAEKMNIALAPLAAVAPLSTAAKPNWILYVVETDGERGRNRTFEPH